MSGAVKAVADGLLGVNRAAGEFGVLRTTLKDRLAGRVAHEARSGPTPYLTRDEESELVAFLVKCAEIGFPERKDEVIGIVQSIVQKKRGTLEGFSGNGWWHRFMERYPDLSLRKSDSLAVARAVATTASTINHYYSVLRSTLEEHGIFNCASQIYNMDESGMPLDHKPRVIARRGMKKVYCRTSGNKAQITIIACASAAGIILPPMVIFNGQRFNPEWSAGEVSNTLYGMLEKGWTDQELFHFLMTNSF